MLCYVMLCYVMLCHIKHCRPRGILSSITKIRKYSARNDFFREDRKREAMKRQVDR